MDDQTAPGAADQKPKDLGLGQDTGFIPEKSEKAPSAQIPTIDTSVAKPGEGNLKNTSGRYRRIVVGLLTLLFLGGGMFLGLTSLKNRQQTVEKATGPTPTATTATIYTPPPTPLPSATPACILRPSCLDAKPYPCQVAEPAEGWCLNTPTPSPLGRATPTASPVSPVTPEPTVVPAGFSLPTWGILIAASAVTVGGVLLLGL